MEAGTVVPTLKTFNLRMHDNQHLILAAGDQEAVVLSPGGSILTSVELPGSPTHALVGDDFSNDGLTDLIVVTSNGVYGFVQTRQPGALFFSTLVGCLIIVMGVIFVSQHLNSIKGKPRVSSGPLWELSGPEVKLKHTVAWLQRWSVIRYEDGQAVWRIHDWLSWRLYLLVRSPNFSQLL